MIELNIPGRGVLQIEHLVCDVNGTLAMDGQLIDGVARALRSLRDRLQIHLITADTHGRQTLIDQQLSLQAVRIGPNRGAESNPLSEAEQKAQFLQRLGADRVAAIGQGANDAAMLQVAGLGICVISREGTAVKTLLAADILIPDILSALELFEKPLRIVATLRD